jgi:hypothetical protein
MYKTIERSPFNYGIEDFSPKLEENNGAYSNRRPIHAMKNPTSNWVGNAWFAWVVMPPGCVQSKVFGPTAEAAIALLQPRPRPTNLLVNRKRK